MSQPDVSVIIATFHPGMALLERCLDSIAAQQGCSIDVVVVDGGSVDGTVDVLKRRSAELGHWHSEPDDGIYDAWNHALPHARGRWIAFVGADDTFAQPDSLARLVAAADIAYTRNGARIAYGRNVVLTADGHQLDVQGEPWPAIRARFQREMVLPHPGALQHRTLFEDHGPFDSSFRIAGDHEFLLRELRNRHAEFVPDTMVCLVGGSGVSRSRSQAKASMRESRRARRQNGLAIRPHEEGSIWLRHWITVLIARVLGDQGATRAKRLVRRALGRDRGAFSIPDDHGVTLATSGVVRPGRGELT
jgi:glycosyltransferase involved in cell wall biosynthesis